MVRTGRRLVFALFIATSSACIAAAPPTPVENARARAQAHIARRVTELRLTDPAKELRESLAIDTGSTIVIRYDQLYEGLPVLGAVLIINVARDRETETNELVLPLSVETTPAVNSKRAEGIARDATKLKFPEQISSTLMIVPSQSLGSDGPSGDRLAWRVEVFAQNETDGLVSLWVYVDAHSGEVLSIISQLGSAAGSVDVFAGATFHGMYNFESGSRLRWTINSIRTTTCTPSRVRVQHPCWGTGVNHGPREARTCGTPIEVACGNGTQTYTTPGGYGNWVGDARGKVTTNVSVMTYDWPVVIGTGQLGTDVNTIAADAYDSIEKVSDFLDGSFGRYGLDGNNGPTLRVVIRHGAVDNAQWSSAANAITIGNGGPDNYPLAALDIVAHEMGHALNDHGPQLQLGPGRESAKLYEAMPDMFAMIVSHNWSEPLWYRIGEKTFRPSSTFSAFRYLDDPALRPGHYVCYNSQIGNEFLNHPGATPAGHMFYLLVDGGTSKCNGNVVQGIGMDAAKKVFWTAFHALPPLATYSTLRQRFIEAATNLANGPTNVVANTAAAFDAINVQ